MSKVKQTDIEKFIEDLLTPKSKDDKTTLDNLFTRPLVDKGDAATHFPHITQGYWQQGDTLYLPNDRGYIYALVVCDVGNRLVDAVAMKARSTEDIVEAFKIIYKRKILQIPKVITFDSGTEFKGSTKLYLQSMGVHCNYAKVGRHRSVSLAERKNQTIGTIIHKIIMHTEITTGQASSAWVSLLPTIISMINKKVKESFAKRDKEIKEEVKKEIKEESKPDMKPDVKPDVKPDIKPDVKPKPMKTIDLLEEGQKVRVMLDEPVDLAGKKKIGTFRSGDLRWSTNIRTIKEVIMQPFQPIMYLLDGDFGKLGIECTGYTRNQLQVVTDKELEKQKAVKAIQEVEENRFEVEKLLEKKIQKGVVYYLVKWKKYPLKDATFERETELMKEIPQMINRFNAKDKKKK